MPIGLSIKVNKNSIGPSVKSKSRRDGQQNRGTNRVNYSMIHKADFKRKARASYTPVSWHHGKVGLLERITKGQIPLRYLGELVRELDSVMEFGLKLMHVGLH